MVSTILKPLSAQMFCFANPARMRFALSAIAGVLSTLTHLLIQEAGYLLSENRWASERQEHVHKSRCFIVTCPGPEATELDCEFPFLCGLGTGVIVSLALVVILPHVCSTGAEPAALRVRRVRLNHREMLGLGSRIVLSYPSEPDRVFHENFGWPFDDEAFFVSIAGD